MDFPDSDFWNYSTQIWILPDVEASCLDLQNDYQANVNILLFCCWIADKNLCLNKDDLHILLETVQPWQTMIKPLRDTRKLLQQQLIAMPTAMIDQTAANISEMELNAEHMSQLALEKALKLDAIEICSSLSNIECNLFNFNLYLQSLENNTSSADLMPLISRLLTAIYQDEESVQLALMSSAASS